MEKTESIQGFYLNRFNTIPVEMSNEIGHFNVFRIGEGGLSPRGLSYSRKNYYKICLLTGKCRISYADESVLAEGNNLVFVHPEMPYSLDVQNEEMEGFFCIFNEAFFSQFAFIRDYPLFKRGKPPVFELSVTQAAEVREVFVKMMQEMDADFAYKHDLLRHHVLGLVYYGMKIMPAGESPRANSNAALRVVSLFKEALDQQFPIETTLQSIRYKSPTDFAGRLAVHVNYLNRVLKEVTGKTTSQLIIERTIQEAKVLLKHTEWNISEVAWCMGFEDLPQFITFFKKSTGLTPGAFRQYDQKLRIK